MKIVTILTNYKDKLKKEGKMPTKRTGFGGRGFTFSEAEQNKISEMKKSMAWVIFCLEIEYLYLIRHMDYKTQMMKLKRKKKP